MSTKLAQFDDFMRLSKFFYRTMGMEPYLKPGDIPRKSLLDDILFYACLININVILLGEFIFVALAFVHQRQFVEATTSLTYIGFVLIGIFKMVHVLLKKKELHSFIYELVRIFPSTKEEQQQYHLQTYLKRCTVVTIGFSVLYMILIWTYNLYAIMQYLIYECWLQKRNVGQSLPYFMFVPWNWKDNWSYYLLYASQIFAGYTSAAGQVASDLLLCSVATQLIMHYDFLAKNIENYAVSSDLIICNELKNNKNMCFLRDMIRYHENLLSLSEKMNDVFGVSLLFNFMSSCFVICLAGFQITVGVDIESTIKWTFASFSASSQVYLICHHGQLLIDASTSITHAVFNQDWSNADVRYKKMLILIAKRAQKPAFLRATQLIKVSRGTMTEMMQISYKFFALLRTMYTK